MRIAAVLKTDNKQLEASTALSNKNAETLPKSSDKNAYELYQGAGHSFGEINVHSNNIPIRLKQKLEINRPGDKYEQEADAMANKVTRISLPFIQRKCSKCKDEEESIHRKPLSTSNASLIQAKEEGGASARDAINLSIQSSKYTGSPLPGTVRSYMEPRFGADFSGVYVHTGQDAIQLNEQLRAQAFTVGNHIYFNSGKYAPESSDGKQLLAHELTHTIQQKSHKKIQRSQKGYQVAMQQKPEPNYGEAAEQLNGESTHIIKLILDSNLKGATKIKAKLYQGGRDNPKVGPCSNICRLTEKFYRQEHPASAFDYSGCEKVPNSQGNVGEATTELLKGKNTEVANDAAEQQEETIGSFEGNLSASPTNYSSVKPDKEIVATDADEVLKDPPVPIVKGLSDREHMIHAMHVLQSIQQVGSDQFTITIDGKVRNLRQYDVDDVHKQAKVAILDGLRQIRSIAQNADSSYNVLSETDKKHYIVAPIIKFIGNIKDPGPILLSKVKTALNLVASAEAALTTNNFSEAATLFVEGERAAIYAEGIYKMYWTDIITTGEITVTALDSTKKTSFILLGILATIATAGAAAGVTSIGGFGLGSATAANAIATAAPLIAEGGEAVIKTANGDKVDWGQFAIDTAFAIVLNGFGGRGGQLVTKIAKKLLTQNPIAKSLGRHVVTGIVHSVIQGKIATILKSAIDTAYAKFKGKDITWEQFIHDLYLQLMDPSNLALEIINGAILGAGQGVGAKKSAQHPNTAVTHQTDPVINKLKAKPPANDVSTETGITPLPEKVTASPMAKSGDTTTLTLPEETSKPTLIGLESINEGKTTPPTGSLRLVGGSKTPPEPPDPVISKPKHESIPEEVHLLGTGTTGINIQEPIKRNSNRGNVLSIASPVDQPNSTNLPIKNSNSEVSGTSVPKNSVDKYSEPVTSTSKKRPSRDSSATSQTTELPEGITSAIKRRHKHMLDLLTEQKLKNPKKTYPDGYKEILLKEQANLTEHIQVVKKDLADKRKKYDEQKHINLKKAKSAKVPPLTDKELNELKSLDDQSKNLDRKEMELQWLEEAYENINKPAETFERETAELFELGEIAHEALTNPEELARLLSEIETEAYALQLKYPPKFNRPTPELPLPEHYLPKHYIEKAIIKLALEAELPKPINVRRGKDYNLHKFVQKVARKGPFFDNVFDPNSLHGKSIHAIQIILVQRKFRNLGKPNAIEFLDQISKTPKREMLWQYIFDPTAEFNVAPVNMPEVFTPLWRQGFGENRD